MHRFFIEKVQGNTADIADAEQLHHIRDVLRLKFNDEVVIFDGAGHEYDGVITAIGRKKIELKLTPLNVPRMQNIKLTIACAIPRGSRMDDIIDYLTQLGVERIIPMRTERVVVKLDDAKAEARLKRWEKIAQSAAQQSQQSRIPIIEAVTRFEDVISNTRDYDLKLIPHLSGVRKPIKDVLAESKPKSIIVLIGPEGDFTPQEVALALTRGFVPVSLGDTVLRVATAAIAVASYIRFAVIS